MLLTEKTAELLHFLSGIDTGVRQWEDTDRLGGNTGAVFPQFSKRVGGSDHFYLVGLQPLLQVIGKLPAVDAAVDADLAGRGEYLAQPAGDVGSIRHALLKQGDAAVLQLLSGL